MIFKQGFDPESLSKLIPPVVKNAGLELITVEPAESRLVAYFTVDDNNVQPHGILHGGVSAMVAETMASIGANLCLEAPEVAVGQTLHACHLKSAPKGQRLRAVSSPVHVGRRSQVWTTDIENSQGQLICRVSLTLAVIQARTP